MTKQEAIEVLKGFVLYAEKVKSYTFLGDENIPIEALNMAIDALTKEPEEDCISMQAAIDVVRQYCIDNQIEDGDYHANGIKYELKELPSAQPEPKRGKWIDVECQLGMQCSECGKMCNEITLCTDMMTEAHWNYCPNCGADMRGDEE